VANSDPALPEYRIMNDVAIRTTQLRKVFSTRTKFGRVRRERREVVAVEGIDLSIQSGEFIGVIGPNGAGKSTTIKMLTGILAPSSGEVHVLGHVPLRERTELAKRIGVVFGQRSQLWWDLPLVDSYTLLRHVYAVPADDHRRTLNDLVERFELGPLLDQPVRTLSLGQRMRAELVAALAHRPGLLFLDEPTIGLDVVSKFAMRDALAEINREAGTTILLTTHDLADVERLCERVVIIDHGRVIRDQSLTDLLRHVDAEIDLEELVRRIYLGQPLG
jgi:ABC-2 type transport system ATP-binding protein